MIQKKLAVLLLVATTACGQSQSSDGEDGDVTTSSRTSAAYASFETYWPSRSATEVAERAHTLAEIMTGRSLPTAPFVEAAEQHIGEAGPWTTMSLEDVSVNYYPEVDDLRVSNPELRKETEEDLTGEGLTPEAAREVFRTTYGALVEHRLLDSRHYDTTKVKSATTVFSVGAIGVSEPSQEVVTEHNFTLMRQINGVDFANAGAKIGVRRTGKIVEIRVGGADVKSQFRAPSESTSGLRLRAVTSDTGISSDLVEVPTGAGEIFDAARNPTESLNDFAKSIPAGRIDWSKVMYMLPMGKFADAGVLEPRYIVSYSELHGGVASRRKYMGYSLRDGSATDLSEIPDPNAAGDQRPE